MADISVTSGYDGLNLPYSPEAEQSVLGSGPAGFLLLGPNRGDPSEGRILPPGQPPMIYELCWKCSPLGQPVDFVTVLDKLKQTRPLTR